MKLKENIVKVCKGVCKVYWSDLMLGCGGGLGLNLLEIEKLS